jgi:hypothetical protein
MLHVTKAKVTQVFGVAARSLALTAAWFHQRVNIINKTIACATLGDALRIPLAYKIHFQDDAIIYLYCFVRLCSSRNVLQKKGVLLMEKSRRVL